MAQPFPDLIYCIVFANATQYIQLFEFLTLEISLSYRYYIAFFTNEQSRATFSYYQNMLKRISRAALINDNLISCIWWLSENNAASTRVSFKYNNKKKKKREAKAQISSPPGWKPTFHSCRGKEHLSSLDIYTTKKRKTVARQKMKKKKIQRQFTSLDLSPSPLLSSWKRSALVASEYHSGCTAWTFFIFPDSRERRRKYRGRKMMQFITRWRLIECRELQACIDIICIGRKARRVISLKDSPCRWHAMRNLFTFVFFQLDQLRDLVYYMQVTLVTSPGGILVLRRRRGNGLDDGIAGNDLLSLDLFYRPFGWKISCKATGL